MTPRLLDSYLAVPAADWDALVPADQPFLRHAFLAALEAGGSVGAARGWQPAPVVLHDAQGALLAAMPGWLKTHSRGEYVFDQSWAEAAWRAGLDYYPKWLCAVPFSPVTGPRLLVVDEAAARTLLAALPDLPGLEAVSGLHVNFTTAQDDTRLAEAEGWLHRQDCQYRWHNAGYAQFSDFTARLTSDRRKKIRQERQKLAALDLSFTWVAGGALDDDLLSAVYACYANTYQVRGQHPYLTPDTFARLCAGLPDTVQVLCVRRTGHFVAMALFLQGSETLYGRYWGALEDIPLLHFETCLYQGIERAIALGLQHFDAGAQGEHKLVRGFEPVLTSSWHRLRHAGLHAAVGDFLRRERAAVAEYRERAVEACPYKN